ncbi:NAD dependent epimerase/dehydratase [Aspergillus ibericus CBS 121593]|uniref:NAD dependent epimerase/dehydratase n=1 Tax=Aspergillus ibericus CBS 121593 TaxID=1448316 RepID=A0A395H3Y5_9EURO|nr:NAD dependent epimerase/dehydratase [Aspergillus ibericus CBS 121593]RAL02330.1 NAD dependent epimerase/dehydratase [Aspergillus ibericus CBS 121593]
MSTAKKTLFLTGGSGYLGQRLIPLAVAKYNYTIRALSRTPTSDALLRSLGAIPIRGDLTSHAVLRAESRSADAIIHLATAYEFGKHASYDEVKHVDMGGIDAMFEGLRDSASHYQGNDGEDEQKEKEKTFITTSGTLITAPDPSGAETNETSPLDPNPINTRGEVEQYVLENGDKERRIKPISIRLAPYVHGHAGSGIRRWMNLAAQTGQIPLVGDGSNRITAVHVDDAAELYLLAVERGGEGEVYNAAAETGVTAGEMFGAVAEMMGVEVARMSVEEAEGRMGRVVARFLSVENRASGGKARRELGWVVRGRGVLEEIREGSYRDVVDVIKNQV